MQPSIDDVRYDLAITRAHMSATLEELDQRLDSTKDVVRGRVDAVKEKLDVRAIIEQHPWAAVGVAIAIGVAVGSSGADRRATSAAVDMAKGLPDAAAGAGSALVEKVKGLRHGDDPAGDAERLANAVEQEGPGLIDRIAGSISDALKLDRFVAELADASRSFAGTSPTGAPPA